MSIDPGFVIHTGDRREPITRVLKGSNNLPVDLTSASSVRFKMRLIGGNGALKVDAAAVIINPANAGTVQYNWAAIDTDTEGWYEAWWEVTYGDTTVQHFPNGYKIVVRVYA